MNTIEAQTTKELLGVFLCVCVCKETFQRVETTRLRVKHYMLEVC